MAKIAISLHKMADATISFSVGIGFSPEGATEYSYLSEEWFGGLVVL